MAVKIVCSMCEVFIKDANANELNRITGKEICKDCAAKLDEAHGFITVSIKQFKQDLEKLVADAKKNFNMLDATYKKFINEATGLQTTTTAEIKRRLEDVLK